MNNITPPSGIKTKRYHAIQIGETNWSWKVNIAGHEVNLPKSVAWWVNGGRKFIDVSRFIADKKKLDELLPREERSRPAPVSRTRRATPVRGADTELSRVLDAYPRDRSDVTNPFLARRTGIPVANIPRCRIKLYALELIDTENYKTTYLTPLGKKKAGQHIVDNVNFSEANKKWTREKKRYSRGQQQIIFSEDDDA